MRGSALTSLPVHDAIPALRRALSESRVVILTAPPGAGKSTVVPLELLDEPWLRGSIVMLQPRRIAARAVAARMASVRRESVGETVGYHVRLDRKTSANTRIEVVTEGILTRRLIGDPGLDGVSLVIFDEFHERSLHADTALAFARRAQETLRDDLRILVMSATLDAEGLSNSFGGAPVVTSDGRLFPVDVRHAADDIPVDRDPAPAMTAAIVRALEREEGDVLAFLPGGSEIRRVVDGVRGAAVAARGDGVDVHALYGDLPLDEQQRAILPGARRRVVVATNIAETSLTIEGVRVVVDSGLARVARFDPGLGMSRIDTVRIARANADQRAGRAGRLGPGVAIRLWNERTHATLAPAQRPEIETADLASTALDLAVWGERDEDLAWVTPPPPGALAQARDLLRRLGAIGGDGRVTRAGREMHAFGAHPRIAHLLLEGERTGAARLASEIAAILEDSTGRATDVTGRVEEMRRGSRDGQTRRLNETARAFRQRLRSRSKTDDDTFDAAAAGRLIAFAFPERIARRREGSRDRFVLASGRGARLPQNDALGANEWLAVAHLDAGFADGPGGSESRIRLAAPLDPATLGEGAGEIESRDVVEWNSAARAITARRERCVGEIVVDSRPLDATDETVVAQKRAALCGAVRSEGLSLVGFSEDVQNWRRRVTALRAWGRDEFPDVSDEALLATLEDWLGPRLDGVRRAEDFARIDHAEALAASWPWDARRRIDAWAPERLVVPTGSQIPLDYEPAAHGGSPVLAVRLQEIFGWTDTPTVNDGRIRVTLHLLSPGFKPVQATQDLRSFWSMTYAEVRKELRARYPRHSWPEDPWTAEPVRGARKKRDAR